MERGTSASASSTNATALPTPSTVSGLNADARGPASANPSGISASEPAQS